MPKRTSQLDSKKIFWDTLRNDPQYIVDLCRRSNNVEYIKHTIGQKLQSVPDLNQKIFDQCFGLIMDKGFAPAQVISITFNWLHNYNLPMSDLMSNYDRFHKKYGPKIMELSNRGYKFR